VIIFYLLFDIILLCLYRGIRWASRFCPFLAVLRRLGVASGIRYLSKARSPLWAAFLRLPKACLGWGITLKGKFSLAQYGQSNKKGEALASPVSTW